MTAMTKSEREGLQRLVRQREKANRNELQHGHGSVGDAASYDAEDDFNKSTAEAYRAVRARVAGGGKGWTPP
jgi:hypothetical protein